jgi:hypothetical protein
MPTHLIGEHGRGGLGLLAVASRGQTSDLAKHVCHHLGRLLTGLQGARAVRAAGGVLLRQPAGSSGCRLLNGSANRGGHDEGLAS